MIDPPMLHLKLSMIRKEKEQGGIALLGEHQYVQTQDGGGQLKDGLDGEPLIKERREMRRREMRRRECEEKQDGSTPAPAQIKASQIAGGASSK